jgi:predicted oxidoreductase
MDKLLLGGMQWNQAITGIDDLLATALEQGIRTIDLADIYQHGAAESCLGDWLAQNPGLRDQLVIQTKCGIRRADSMAPGRYDASADHLLTSVEQSLRRLQTEYIDVLLLHRPDPLMCPNEVADAFGRLRHSGKVRAFGVSNMHAGQIAWLQRALDAPLVANQVEMSLLHRDWLEAETTFNDAQSAGVTGWAGTLQYCQTQGIQLQAWRPLCRGWLTGNPPPDAPATVQQTALVVQELAQAYAVSPEAIVLGWLMRHPAGIHPVVGTSQPARLRACAQALALRLTREDWYRLYVTARGRPLP